MTIQREFLGTPLPPIQAETLDDPQTPVENGSFLINEKENICEGRQAPLDPETGLPYLVVPSRLAPMNWDHTRPTFHHLRYYKADKHLGGGTGTGIPERLGYEKVAGLAVRVSIGTYMIMSTHERVHDRFPVGPTTPTHVTKKFETAVKNAVGIVPRRVIDVTRPIGEEIITPDDDLFAKTAAASGYERFNSQSGTDRTMRTLCSFFMRYAALEKDYVQVDDNFVDQILSTDDEDKRIDLAYEVLQEGLENAVEPLLPQLAEWRREGFILPGRADAITELRRITSIKRVLHVLPLLHPEIAKTLESEQKAA